jgi:hypothetical protein
MSDSAPNPIKLRWFLWTPLGLALFVVIGFYSVQKSGNYNSYDDQRAAARYEVLKKLRADEQAILTTADWVDQGKKIVRIPIEEAMAEEIDTLKAKPAAMGCLIPAANAAPAASSTNTAMGTNSAPASSSTNTPTTTNSAAPPPTH